MPLDASLFDAASDDATLEDVLLDIAPSMDAARRPCLGSSGTSARCRGSTRAPCACS